MGCPAPKERTGGQSADTPATPESGGPTMPPKGKNGVLSLARLLARRAVIEHMEGASTDG